MRQGTFALGEMLRFPFKNWRPPNGPCDLRPVENNGPKSRTYHGTVEHSGISAVRRDLRASRFSSCLLKVVHTTPASKVEWGGASKVGSTWRDTQFCSRCFHQLGSQTCTPGLQLQNTQSISITKLKFIVSYLH